MKEKSTILPYSIHKRIHVRPLRNLIQGIHVNVNTIQSTVLKEAAIRNSGLRHARAGPGSIRAKRRKESSGTPIIHDRSSLHTLHSPNQDGIPSLSESSTRYTLGNTKGASHHWNTTRAVPNSYSLQVSELYQSIGTQTRAPVLVLVRVRGTVLVRVRYTGTIRTGLVRNSGLVSEWSPRWVVTCMLLAFVPVVWGFFPAAARASVLPTRQPKTQPQTVPHLEIIPNFTDAENVRQG